MGADPKPYQVISDLYRECAMVAANARRPEASDLLEVKRRVTRVLFEAFVGLIR